MPTRRNCRTAASRLRKGTGGEDGYSAFTVRDPESGEEQRTALERMLRERGVERIVVAGLKGQKLAHELPVDDIIYKELTIRGVLSMSVDDTFRAIELIESGRYPFAKMHTHSFPLDQAEDAIHALAGGIPGMNPLHIAIVPGAPRVLLPA